MKLLYSVYDALSEALVGPVMSFPAHAAAIRTFGDIASDSQSSVAKHPHDFELLCLGSITDAGEISPRREVVITGSQWVAAQQGEPKIVKEA